MPKRSRKPIKKTRPVKRAAKRPARDANQMAFNLVRRVEEMGTPSDGKNPLAVALGRLGGLKGGRVRADRMTDEERSASASRAAQARWKRRPSE